MKTGIRNSLLLTLLLAVLFVPSMVQADPGNQYCITPPFITAGVKPNLLLMIDNSASMYDLAYVDKGKKHCAVTTGTACFSDTDCTGKCSTAATTSCTQDSECPSSGTCDTCSAFDRSPYYCFDQTYSSANSYYGYFDKDKFYYHRTATDDFAEVASVFPSGCPTSGANITNTIPNTMCLEYTPGTGTVVSFVAKGNYLNWLTSSKMDVEKKILTGGKFDGSGMIPESRGCVGQGYLKQALSADFTNFNTGATDPNKVNALPVTFTITGPQNPYNITAPSTGGQTFINIFAGRVYDYGVCQKAMQSIVTASVGTVKQDVADCLADTGAAAGYCRLLPTLACSSNTNCNTAVVPAHCSKNAAMGCTGTSDVTSCVSSTVKACNVGGAACTVDNDCRKAATYYCSKNHDKTCTNIANECNVVEKMGSCSLQSSKSCRDSSQATDCQVGSNYKGPCVGYTAPVTDSCVLNAAAVDNSPCNAAVTTDFGPCLAASGGYVGDCVLSTQAAAVQGKVVFNQAMQSCVKVRGKTLANCNASNDYCFVNGDLSSTFAKCPDVYSGFATCHNNHFQMCTTSADCGGNPCDYGPLGIVPGHPALFCAEDYMGQFYAQDSNSNWVRKAGVTDTQIYAAYWDFCSSFAAPPVTDPTDAPSNTATTDNVPAILSGVGVEAQLGGAIATMRAKVAVTTPACTTDSDCVSLSGTSCVSGTCKPTGLVQQFGNMIRLGAMSFNSFGSASEAALIGTPKTCSNGSICTKDIDCGGTVGSCATATNLDGGRILHKIGSGLCATMNSTPCNVNADCSGFNTCLNGYCGTKGSTPCTTVANCSGSNQACISNGVGDHTTAPSLINTLDIIPANSWTPFSEAFYNAIGYFARVPSGADAGKSRTDLRLAAADFDENYNPSEYRCQQNYLLLVSDGSSTADRNPRVADISGVDGATSNGLAAIYASPAGITQTNCTGAPTGTATDYGGNNNLPIMAWLAKNRKIADFSTTTASTETPTTARDSITSYVVFNGESNGASGDCNSRTLLSKTAAKGGTVLRQANNYPALVAELTSVFQDVAAKAASGTAASILSNSEGSGANILQAVFYPKKIFEDQTAVNWIGEMQNLWYFVDPYINNSTIREDSFVSPATVGDRKLNLVTDLVARFAFDVTSDRTMVQLYQDTDGNGSADVTVGGLIDPDVVKSIWRAGKLLWSRNLLTSPRTIYTPLITGGTEVTGTGMMKFTYGDIGTHSFPDHSTLLQPYLQLPSSNADAKKLMKFVHGFGFPAEEQTVPPTMRPRTVKIGSIPASTVSTVVTDPYVTEPRDKGIGVWKLGDIISSTPRVQSTVRLNTYNMPAPGGYADKSYESFVNSKDYLRRGSVYVGANDGMLHAFNLGILKVESKGFEKATLDVPAGTTIGDEKWAFIPKNFLPYLKYQADPAYQHLYAVDGRTLIVDASIGDTNSGTCIKDTYWKCDKLRNGSIPMVDANNNLDPTKNVWRTIVIGGMGLGGASRRSCPPDTGVVDDACVKAPINDPADATKSLGYSSYFALDVTDPDNPKLLWEFSDNTLGFSTTGPAIIRVGDKDKNGRWFAVFGNGPFGPIDPTTHQFKGNSDHHLRYFIVDLRTGVLVNTITTTVDNGFAGSMLAGAIDTDRRDKTLLSNYQDDAIYTGYVKKVAGGGWTDGGVGRIMIKPVPAGSEPDDTWAAAAAGNFNWSAVIDGVGPVTTSIARLQDTRALNKNLWLYFGTGRYYYRDGTGLDDYGTVRSLYGIKEPCYNTTLSPGNVLDPTCSASIASTAPVDQTTTISTLADTDKGWRIDMDDDTTTEGAERVVTDSVALTNGTVFFTSFKPTMDICGFGGNSFLWGIKYDSGGQAAASSLQGKALIQLSTGEFKEVDLKDAFQDKQHRRMATPMTGKPPSDAPPIISNSQNKPVKKILHIQEH